MMQQRPLPSPGRGLWYADRNVLYSAPSTPSTFLRFSRLSPTSRYSFSVMGVSSEATAAFLSTIS